LLQSGKGIEKQSSKQSLTLEQERAALVGGYLYKYGVIANRAVDPELIAIYVEALDGLEARRIEKGLKEYLRDGTVWPWPGTLRQYIEEEV
jgi:hypothetical protein